MSDTTERFIWVDIETTGLDPYNDLLLEIGFRVTDTDLNLIAEHDWQIWDDQIAEGGWDEFIQKMHTKSGLFDDCNSHGLDITTVQQEVTGWLKEFEITKSDPMCGSSVQFDRSFIGAHLPLVHDLFSYRNIDISTIKELCRRLNPVLYGKLEGHPAVTKRELHRALPDLQDTISEANFYFQEFLILGD